jgi:DNA-binding response OmpR family regulator
MNRSAAVRAPTPSEEMRLPERDSSLRILLAEQDAQMRSILGLVLHQDGHDVVEAQDSGELLEALAATLIEPSRPDFDLVICEHTLPGIPGLSVLAGLRGRARDTGFILITDHPAVAARARRLGAEVLQSTFDVRALRGAIRRIDPRIPRP